MTQRHTQNGFTIIELLFATSVFSIILLVSLSALAQIGRMYYKGVTTSQTQETARNLMDELSQSIQLSADGVTTPTGPAGPNIDGANPATLNTSGYFCIGSTRYSYVIDRQLSDSPSLATGDKQIRHVLWADVLSACATASNMTPLDLTKATPTAIASTPAFPSPVGPGIGGRELLGTNMRLTQLSITRLSSDTSTWQIKLTVAYGDEDLFAIDSTDPTRKICRGLDIGTQFCAFSELSTIVKRRI